MGGALSSWTHGAPPLDRLEDGDLARLNRLLDWRCFVLDQSGRRFGRPGGADKRSRPQALPDRRVLLLHERFDLSDKHVLEVGCFEGVHTVALCRLAARVTAMDGRLENVVKTIVRCAFFDLHPTVLKWDLESGSSALEAPADVIHHVGVLYHLRDPISHLLDLAAWTTHGLLLDTHYVEDGDADAAHTVNGLTVRYRRYSEGGVSDPFSGLYDHSKWLRLDDIAALLEQAGFTDIHVVETRKERNGPRATITARRS